jgi:phytoene desaturase
VIAHIELTGGVWYPQGGVYRLAQAMERLANELGVEIRTDCPVERIEVQGGQARGVLLADGTRLAARSVIANVDVIWLYQHLLPDSPAVRSRLKRLRAREPSCSGFILLLGVQGQHPQLAHHNIFFSSDYPAEFEQIFRRGVAAREPTIYVAITSKTDPHHAPPGCENWFILVNAPALGAHFDWRQESSAYRDLVLARLAEFGVEVRGRLLYEQILTPIDVEQMTNAYRGALYGASSNHRLAAFLRPPNRSRDVAGLYLAGGTAHPGGGVPMVILSGKQAAAMLIEDQAGQA